MSRLHIGAFGTLGIIVEATFKVSPIPKKLATIAGRFDTLTSAAGAARALRLARIVPWSLALAGPGVLPGAATGYTVAVRLGGQAAVVDPQAQRALDTLKEAQASSPAMLDDAEDNLWPVVRDWPDLAAGADGILVRMGLAPSQVLNVMTAAGDVAARHGLHAQMLAHPGAATIHLCLSGPGDKAVDAVAGLVAVVKEWNGNLVVERCPSALKDRLPVWGLAASDALSQRVKETFDPKGTLNPGRFVGL
jgi:glycolate oxidase FAD binding subunit